MIPKEKDFLKTHTDEGQKGLNDPLLGGWSRSAPLFKSFEKSGCKHLRPHTGSTDEQHGGG